MTNHKKSLQQHQNDLPLYIKIPIIMICNLLSIIVIIISIPLIILYVLFENANYIKTKCISIFNNMYDVTYELIAVVGYDIITKEILDMLKFLFDVFRNRLNKIKWYIRKI